MLAPLWKWTGPALPVIFKGRTASERGGESIAFTLILLRVSDVTMSTGQETSREHHESTAVQKCSTICLIYVFIQNQGHLLCSQFWLHATSTLEYHSWGNLDQPGQPPSATGCLVPSWIRQTPPCMTFSSWYGACFDGPDFLIGNLDTSSWKTMLRFFPSSKRVQTILCFCA